MPRRNLNLLVLAGLALAPSACRDRHEGAVKVTVIGAAAKVRDPALTPLSAPDAVLISAVGQGLVRFDAAGNIVPGLAERWNVSDDGLSYIFRIESTDWPGRRKFTAQQVARILKRSIAESSVNPLKDTVGAIDDIVAMTDRVIEIRLKAPRPNLLNLLAQPEFGIVRNETGTGPFQVDPKQDQPGELRLTREIASADEETTRRDEVALNSAPAQQAVRAFAAGNTDLVLGGTFSDLPYAQRIKLPRGSLRFDPASGLLGLIPTRPGTALDDVGVRQLLSQAIDRDALVDALRVPGLAARATVLEPGLDGLPNPTAPPWAGTSLADRRASLSAESARQFGQQKPTIRIYLPGGPGSDILFNRLMIDWGAIGITAERAKNPLASDLKLIDAVAPSTSPAWFLRQFRCQVAPICDKQADELLDAARDALLPAQRYALLSQAAAKIDEMQLFIPLAAPVRWSLVSDRIQGFVGNRYARHTLTDLEQKLSPGPS
ncbi:MAG TPA: ABC transporter substrate-binding protein [Sphingomicrobium sp.]